LKAAPEATGGEELVAVERDDVEAAGAVGLEALVVAELEDLLLLPHAERPKIMTAAQA
jgi:hypothetical protein